MLYRYFAVARLRGTSLDTDGPVLSERIRWISPPPLESDWVIITNTRTPMPPTQWVKLRQNKLDLLSASTSVRMLAPVVVKPDTVSKNASTKEGISPLNTKGNAPPKLSTAQPKATATRPSRE